MRFYNATTFLFPKHYEWRILCICFGAVHLPLIAYVGLQAATGHWDVTTLLTLLAATLVGTGLGLAIVAAIADRIESPLVLRSPRPGTSSGFEASVRLLQPANPGNSTGEHFCLCTRLAPRFIIGGVVRVCCMPGMGRTC